MAGESAQRTNLNYEHESTPLCVLLTNWITNIFSNSYKYFPPATNWITNIYRNNCKTYRGEVQYYRQHLQE